jgi:hypothetical protein
MVAWPTICKPTHLGGLGISDLKLEGFTLLTRWLWLQKTDQERAWSELPIKTSPEVHAFFQASTYTVVGDGWSTLFWEDKWIHGDYISNLAPCLYQIVPSQTRQRQSVKEVLTNRQWVRAISGGSLANNFRGIFGALDHHGRDKPQRLAGQACVALVTRWCVLSQVSIQHAQTSAVTFYGHQLMWKTWAPLRVKIFLWLALWRGHWTVDWRTRHGLKARDHCYLCDQAPETIDHIIASCPFTRELWHLVGIY